MKSFKDFSSSETASSKAASFSKFFSNKAASSREAASLYVAESHYSEEVLGNYNLDPRKDYAFCGLCKNEDDPTFFP